MEPDSARKTYLNVRIFSKTKTSDFNAFQPPKPRDTPPIRPLESDADVSTGHTARHQLRSFIAWTGLMLSPAPPPDCSDQVVWL